MWEFAALAPGPTLIQSATTTVLLRLGDHARNDARGWLEIDIGSAETPGQ